MKKRFVTSFWNYDLARRRSAVNNPEEWAKRMNELKKPIEMRIPVPISGQPYNFDDVM